MTSRRRTPRPSETKPKGELKAPRPVWFVTLMAFVLPGSGQVFNGAPARGVIMQFGIVFGAFVSYQLTTPEISPIGRMAGGLAMWVFSIVDANGIAKRRVSSWARIQAEQSRTTSGKGAGEGTGTGKGVNQTTADTGAKRGARKHSAAATARRAGLSAGASPVATIEPAVPGDGAITTLGPPEPQGG